MKISFYEVIEEVIGFLCIELLVALLYPRSFFFSINIIENYINSKDNNHFKDKTLSYLKVKQIPSFSDYISPT